MKMRLQMLRRELKSAFTTPTLKQKEAYGRVCHTLASAGIVGLITVVHLDDKITQFIAARAIALAISAMVLFIVGSILSKGE